VPTLFIVHGDRLTRAPDVLLVVAAIVSVTVTVVVVDIRGLYRSVNVGAGGAGRGLQGALEQEARCERRRARRAEIETRASSASLTVRFLGCLL